MKNVAASLFDSGVSPNLCGVGGCNYKNFSSHFDLRRRSYGPLDYDRTDSFSTAYNWLLPEFAQQRFLKHLVNRWQLTGITQFQRGVPVRSLDLAGTTSDGIGAGDPIDIIGTLHMSAQPFLICDPRVGRREGE